MKVPVFPCERCGAPLPLEAIVAKPHVRCAHCGAESAIDDARRARVLAHLAEVREAWRKTLSERRDLLQSKNSVFVAVFVFALIFSVLLTIVVLSPDFPVHWSLIVFTLGVYAVIGLSGRRAFQIPSAAMLLASGLGACAHCGGPVGFEEGASSATCAYCCADCLVSPSIEAQMIAAAEERLQITVALQREAERKNAPFERFMSRFGWLLVVCMTGFIPAYFVFAYFVLPHPETNREWGRPVVLVALALLIVWGVRGFNQTRRQQLAFDDVLWGRIAPSKPPAPGSASKTCSHRSVKVKGGSRVHRS